MEDQKGSRSASPSSQPTIPTDTDDAAIQEFLAILEEHRAECVQNGMYAEAEVAQKRLDELRAHERGRKAEAIRARHIAERLDVEEAHMLEFESFNSRWDKKVQEYDERTEMLEEAMREKHQEELEQWQEDMQNQFLLRPKYSKDLLNLRKIQETLAQQRDYAGAQKVKLKADDMQKWELEALKKEWRKKVATKQGKFIQRQQAEQAAFAKRIDQGREKQKRIRQEKLNRILQRYQNIKQGLTRQQHLEAVREAKNAEVVLQPQRRSTGQTSGYAHPRTNIREPWRSGGGNDDFLPPRSADTRKQMMGTTKSQLSTKAGMDRRLMNSYANNKSGKGKGFTLPDARSRLNKSGAATQRSRPRGKNSSGSQTARPGSRGGGRTAVLA